MTRRFQFSLGDKPLAKLRRFARKLGWRELRIHQRALEDGTLITYYTAGRIEDKRVLFLQINECPIGQVATYTACVYALRYRIVTGWHSMRADDDEAQRLNPWLHRRWFDTPADRRAFRTMHPECGEWSWRRIRREPLPYIVVDAADCVTARSD